MEDSSDPDSQPAVNQAHTMEDLYSFSRHQCSVTSETPDLSTMLSSSAALLSSSQSVDQVIKSGEPDNYFFL